MQDHPSAREALSDARAMAAWPEPGVTAILAAFAAKTAAQALPATAREIAQFSVLDWAAVGLAGVPEPVSRSVRALVVSEGGAAEATVLGASGAFPARAAALANGATSHALDYDDTHFDHVGHPSVAVLPAALATAERIDASGAALLDAFLIGAETSCRIGAWLGTEHYAQGFHQTATAGAFGATAAAARVLGLSVEETRHALGLTATRASGLKSQFGTMGKPFNAGIAASNGVEAALLVAHGFRSRPDGIECAQGFLATHSASAPEARSSEAFTRVFGDLASPAPRFRFEQVRYKHHACCHGLHAALEAIGALRREIGFPADAVAAIEIRTNPRWLKVCDIPEPSTGLEAKFSYRLSAAMALAGVDTAALESWSEATCARPDLVALRDRVLVAADPEISDTATAIALRLASGETTDRSFDVNEDPPRPELRAKLDAKAVALLGAKRAARLAQACDALPDISTREFARALREIGS